MWLKADRGPIEAFGDFQEMQEYGDVETYNEYEELWKELYPNEVSWFSFAAVDDPDISYRAIFLNHKHVIEVESTHSEGFPQNISPLCPVASGGCAELPNPAVRGGIQPTDRCGTAP